MKNLMLALLLLFCLPATAEIYKWTDAEGRVHFGDKPTDKKIRAEEVNVQDYKPGTDAATRDIYERRQRLLDADADKKSAAKNPEESRAKAREAACNEAREKMRRISGRVIFQDRDGNPVHVTEQQRIEKQKELDVWLRENCG